MTLDSGNYWYLPLACILVLLAGVLWVEWRTLKRPESLHNRRSLIRDLIELQRQGQAEVAPSGSVRSQVAEFVPDHSNVVQLKTGRRVD